MNRTRRAAAAFCASAAMVLGLLVGSASPGWAQTVGACPVSTEDQAVDAEEQSLLGLINQYRQSNGKSALSMHPGVTRAAAWFSRDMATKNYFPGNHVDSNGRSVDQRLSWCGVSYSNWAENIYAGSPNAQDVFNAWRASASYNANMLRDGVTSAGIARAYAAGSTYGWYWTLDLTNTAAQTTPTTATATTTTRPPATTTTTRPPATATTTTVPSTGPAPGTLEWYLQQYGGYTTTTTRPPAATTTTRPPTTTTTRPPATATTTTVPSTGPAPGTAEWYWQQYSRYRTGG